MGLFGSKTRAKDSRTERGGVPSRSEIQREAEKAGDEIQKGGGSENAKKLNVFTRFMNWVSGIFGRKNEPNLEQGATMKGNMPVAEVDISGTLSPTITDAGITEYTSEIEESSAAAPVSIQDADISVSVEETLDDSDLANSDVNVTDTANAAENAAENVLVDESAAENAPVEENDAESAPAEEVSSASPTLTADNITFDTYEFKEYTFSDSGTVKISGKDVPWTTTDRINIASDENDKLFGSGMIQINDEKFSCAGGVKFLMMNSKVQYMFDSSLCYTQDGIKIDLGTDRENLNELKLNQVRLLNYALGGDAPLDGDVTIDAEGFKGSAVRVPQWKPKYVEGGDVKIALGTGNDAKLGFSLMPQDAKIMLGIQNVLELRSGVLTVTVLEDGTITYHVPETYNVNVLNGLYTADVALVGAELTAGKELNDITVPDFDFETQGAALTGVSLNLSSADGGKSAGFTAKQLTYKGLTLNNLSGSIGDKGITAGGTFSVKVGDTELSGGVENFTWNTGEFFSVKNLTVNAETITVNDDISVDGAKFTLSFVDKALTLAAEANLNFKNLRAGMLSVSTDALNVGLSLTENGGNYSFAVSFKGSAKLEIGSADNPTASAELKDVSYADGVFDVKTASAQTTFNKLISDKFSGSAVLKADGLKFSNSAAASVDLTSMELSIANLDYHGKTLASNTSVALIFKEKQEEKTAPVKGDLAVGNTAGALSEAKIAVYLTENKRGFTLAASRFSPSLGEYLSADFHELNANFIGGAEDITAKTAEIKSGEKLSKVLGDKGITISTTDFSINSDGIKFGSIKASLGAVTIANALSFQNLEAEALLNDDQTLKNLSIAGSAQLGDIALSEAAVSTDGQNTAFSAKSIKYEKKNFEITDASGQIGENGVSVAAANFALTIAGKAVSGTLVNLNWSNESNFSVEKLNVTVDSIKLNDEISVNGAEINLSIKDKMINFGANGTLHIGETQKGIVKINAADLKISLELGKVLNEGGSETDFNGAVEGTVKVNIGDIASAEAGDISYNNGRVSVGTFGAEADLSKLGYEKLGGTGTVSVNGLGYKKGEAPSIESAKLDVSGVTLNGKELMSNLFVNIILNDAAQPSGDQLAAADKAPIKLDEKTEGEVEGLNVSVYLTDTFKGVKMNASKFNIKLGNFTFDFSTFAGEFSKGSCNVNAEKASVSASLPEELSKIAGINALELTADNASYRNGKFSVGKVSATATTDINIAGISISKASAEFAFDEGMNLKNVTIGGDFGYEDYLSGSASVIVDSTGKISFGSAGNIKISYGCFGGSIANIVNDGDTLTFNTLKLKKVEGKKVGDEFEGGPTSPMGKLLQSMPNIGITLDHLTFNKGVPVKPSFSDISLDEFEKEFNIGKLTAKVKYTNGESKGLDITLQCGMSMPEDENDKKRKTVLKGNVPIIPAILSAEFTLGLNLSLNGEFGAGISIEKNGDDYNLSANVNADANAYAGFFGEAALVLGSPIAGVKGGLGMELGLPSTAHLDGSLGVKYDSQAESFFKAFSLIEGKTNLNFNITSEMTFKVYLMGGLTGLPAIFTDNKLYHTWDLFNYTLGTATISGGVKYVPEAGKYVFSVVPEITGPGVHKYNPEKVESELKEYGKNYDDIKAAFNDISAAMQKAKMGVNESKGSKDEVQGGLTDEIDADKKILMPELKKRIDDVFAESKDNSIKCHALMEKVRKEIDKSAEHFVENERNVEQLEKVISDSQKALDIIGFNSGDKDWNKNNDNPSMDKNKYKDFISAMTELDKDEAKITELAMLDPAAVVNMFKAFKLEGSSRWKDIHSSSKDMTDKPKITAAGNNYKSQINSKLYSNAMTSVSDIMKKTENSIRQQEDMVKKAELALENAKKIREEAEKQLEETVQKIQAAEKTRDERLAAIQAAKEKKIAEIDNDGRLENLKDTEFIKNTPYLNRTQKKKLRIYLTKDSPDKRKEIENSFLKAVSDEKNAKEQQAENSIADVNKAYDTDSAKLGRELQLLANKKLQAGIDITNAEYRVEDAKAELEMLKYRMSSSGDISSAINVFQGFISEEHNQTSDNIAELRKTYGVGTKQAAPDETELEARKENVHAIIAQLIKDATDEQLEKHFDNEKAGKRSNDRYSSRIKIINEGSGLVDVSMKAYGLTGSKNNESFKEMKKDNEYFKTMQKQLDETYNQLTDYHKLITEVLKSWNVVNGIDYKGLQTATDISTNSDKAVNLINQVDQVKSKEINANVFETAAASIQNIEKTTGEQTA